MSDEWGEFFEKQMRKELEDPNWRIEKKSPRRTPEEREARARDYRERRIAYLRSIREDADQFERTKIDYEIWSLTKEQEGES